MVSSIREIRSLERFRTFIRSKKLVFIFFYSAFTEPVYLSHYSAIAEEKAGHFQYGMSTAYGTVYTQLLPSVADEANVEVSPTLVAYKDGMEHKRLEGSRSKWETRTFIEEALKETLG